MIISLVSGTPSDNTSKTNAYYYLMATLTLEALLDEGSRYILRVPCLDTTVNPNISLSWKYARFRPSLHRKTCVLQFCWRRHSLLNIYWIYQYLIATPFKQLLSIWHKKIYHSRISGNLKIYITHTKQPCTRKYMLLVEHIIHWWFNLLYNIVWITKFPLYWIRFITTRYG